MPAPRLATAPPGQRRAADRLAGSSQRLVPAVAERGVTRRLAAAQEDFFSLGRGEDSRPHPDLLVGAVAIRLRAAPSTRAPRVFLIRDDLDGIWGFLRDDCFA